VDLRDLFGRLDDLAAAGDVDGVERAALAALEDAGPDDAADLWLYVAWARFEQGRLPQALTAAREALDPLYEAKALFHLWRFDDASAALARCPDEGEDGAEAAWYRGLCAEFARRDAAAHFRRAAELAPDLFPAPVRLSDAEVDAVVHGALDALPEEIAAVVREAVVAVRPLPQPHADVDPLTLGLYVEKQEDGAQLPSQIEVYRLNIERLGGDRDTVIGELRITLLHEIAHHLGYDEEGVEALGLR